MIGKPLFLRLGPLQILPVQGNKRLLVTSLLALVQKGATGFSQFPSMHLVPYLLSVAWLHEGPQIALAHN